MGKAFVIGVGINKFSKPGVASDDYPIWVKEVVEKALSDAKIDYSYIQQVFASYVMGDSGHGQRAIQEIGLTGIPVFNVNNNCSSGASSLYIAKEFIEMGSSDCILVFGFEKMDSRCLWPQFTDRAFTVENHTNALSKLREFSPNLPTTHQLFAAVAVEHMERYGTTLQHLAKIAYKNRKHGVNNPYAHFQKEYTIEEILNSPKVCGPLTRLECCPMSNGAAAVVLASERFVREHNLQSQAVEILGMEIITDLPETFNSNSCISIAGYNIIKEVAERLFKKTNKSVSDVQVIELHDSFSSFELVLYEALGLCPPGKGGEFVDRGDNTYGGKYVINPSGGLTSRGHPFGATGVAQCIELCLQLRGEAGKRQVQNVNLALQQNIGLATACIVALYQKATLD